MKENILYIDTQDQLNEIAENPLALELLYQIYDTISIKTADGSWIPIVRLPESNIPEGRKFIIQRTASLETKIYYDNTDIIGYYTPGFNETWEISFVAGLWYIDKHVFVFNEFLNPVNDLTNGDLKAKIMYAQSIIIDNKNNVDGSHVYPHLTANRDTLLMFLPIDIEIIAHLSVKALDINGKELGIIELLSPEHLPAHDGSRTESKSTYSNQLWSCILPASWVANGLNLIFYHNSLVGEISNISVGSPSELLLHTIDIGMLTPPRNKFSFADDLTLHNNYFQTTPASKMIVSKYEPIHLTTVVLPDGTVYTDKSADDTADWHNGDMRQIITKVLINHGIDMGNYGIHCSDGILESAHPYYAAQIVVCNSLGNYQNGITIHGGSGGNGMTIIEESIGNELSHEVGHNYSLGHFNGKSFGSMHRPSTDVQSTWGWNQHYNKFIANFFWNADGNAIYAGGDDELVVPPFYNHKFNTGSMAGGVGSDISKYSKYTLYTPYESEIIQTFLENKIVFDEYSSTGFSKWNNNTKQMEEYAREEHISSDGTIITQDDFNTIQDDQDGNFIPKKLIKPIAFGVPVVTIVGYYDPKQELTSYLYPALFGSYGYVYATDTEYIVPGNYVLRVYTKNGNFDYLLEQTRIYDNNIANNESKEIHKNDTINCGCNNKEAEYNKGFTCGNGSAKEKQREYLANYMNKLHVNIKQSDEPYSAEILHILDMNKYEVLAFIEIGSPTQEAIYTVNGILSNSKLLINNQEELNKIKDVELFRNYYHNYFTIQIDIVDGTWLPSITLPKIHLDKQKLIITNKASNILIVQYNETESIIIELNSTYNFAFINGRWIIK